MDSKYIENLSLVITNPIRTALLPPHKFFHDYLFYVDRFHLETGEPIFGNDLILIEHQIMIHGGSISKKIDYGVTHIICCESEDKEIRLEKIYESIKR